MQTECYDATCMETTVISSEHHEGNMLKLELIQYRTTYPEWSGPNVF